MHFLKSINSFLQSIGLSFLKFKNLIYIFKFGADLIKFFLAGGKVSFLSPILGEHKLKSGNIDKHYFKLDLFVANLVFKNAPKNHLDIGSRFDGFVTHLASFREVDVIDIRPNQNKLMNIKFRQIDITDKIDENQIEKKYESVSCLHALEHFGLGRYGDKIDPLGYISALNNIEKLIDTHGLFYLALPISSKFAVYFNAHRVFEPSQILKYLGSFALENFHYINDKGELITNSKIEFLKEKKFDYYCGIYILRKKG